MKVLLAILLFPACALARLGDSEAQLIARYGQPTKRETTVKNHPGVSGIYFQVSGVDVQALLLEGC